MEDSRDTPPTSTDPSAFDAPGKAAPVIVELRKSILRLTGKDPVGMLNAILTNDVPKEGAEGAYAMLLNPKGRVQTDLRALKSGEDILIVTEPEGMDAAKEILGRYAPFSRVKLEDLPHWDVVGLYGPRAKDLLGIELSEHESARVDIANVTVLVTGVTLPVPGYDLIGPAETLRSVRNHLSGNGAALVDLATYETARIEAGVPRFGADIKPENFPGETGVVERAVSFSKGCYPGQEIVARMHYRGHPNKRLHRLVVEDEGIEPGARITQNGKAVGTVTSVAPLPVDGKTLALGYLSRGADLQAPLEASGRRILLEES